MLVDFFSICWGVAFRSCSLPCRISSARVCAAILKAMVINFDRKGTSPTWRFKGFQMFLFEPGSQHCLWFVCALFITAQSSLLSSLCLLGSPCWQIYHGDCWTSKLGPYTTLCWLWGQKSFYQCPCTLWCKYDSVWWLSNHVVQWGVVTNLLSNLILRVERVGSGRKKKVGSAHSFETGQTTSQMIPSVGQKIPRDDGIPKHWYHRSLYLTAAQATCFLGISQHIFLLCANLAK